MLSNKRAITIESIAPDSLSDAADLSLAMLSPASMPCRYVTSFDFMYYKEQMYSISNIWGQDKKDIRIISENCSDLG